MAKRSSSESRAAWKRLRRLYTWRSSRSQVAVGALLAVLGFAATVQVQALRADDDYSASSRTELIQHLDTLQNHAQRLEGEINELERNRNKLLSGADQTKEAVEQAERRAEVLGILSGSLPARGPGVRVTIPQTPQPVEAGDVINAIEELRDAGAEAIELNDRVRIVAGSAVLDHKERPVLVVDDTVLSPPYVIDAIGDPDALGKAMTIPGGVADTITELGGETGIDRRKNIHVESLHVRVDPKYAEQDKAGD